MSIYALNSRTNSKLIFDLVLNFPNGSSKVTTIQEGIIVKDLVYEDANGELCTIDGRVRVIDFNSKLASSPSIADCLEKSVSVFSKYVKPCSLIIDGSGIYDSNVVNIPITNIKDIKADKFIDEVYQGEVHEASDSTSLVAALENAVAGDTVLLAAGDYSEPLTLNKAVRITPKKDADGNYEEVVFSNTMVVDCESGTVQIDHVEFKNLTSPDGVDATSKGSKGSAIKVSGNTEEFILCDNKFTNFNNFTTNVFIDADNTKVVIENNVFAEGSSYHVIGWNNPRKVGNETRIEGNVFGDVCVHNVITCFGYEEGANIYIKDNKFANSSNAIRLSNIESDEVHVHIINNTYDKTDETNYGADPLCTSEYYGGLVILQDYTGDQDFSKVHLYYSNNYYTPVGGPKVIIDEGCPAGPTQPYYVYVKDPNFITHPQVEFYN